MADFDVNIGGSTRNLQQATQRAERLMRGFGRQARRSLSTASRAGQGLVRTMGRVSRIVGAVGGVGGAAGFAGLIIATRQLALAQRDLNREAAEFALTPRQFQLASAAANAHNVDVMRLADAYREFTRVRLPEARRGEGEPNEALQRLGIDPRQLGQAEAAIGDVIDALRNLNEESRREAIGQLFGGSAEDISFANLQLLEFISTAEGLAELEGIFGSFLPTPEESATLAQLGQDITDIESSVRSLLTRLAASDTSAGVVRTVRDAVVGLTRTEDILQTLLNLGESFGQALTDSGELFGDVLAARGERAAELVGLAFKQQLQEAASEFLVSLRDIPVIGDELFSAGLSAAARAQNTEARRTLLSETPLDAPTGADFAATFDPMRRQLEALVALGSEQRELQEEQVETLRELAAPPPNASAGVPATTTALNNILREGPQARRDISRQLERPGVFGELGVEPSRFMEFGRTVLDNVATAFLVQAANFDDAGDIADAVLKSLGNSIGAAATSFVFDAFGAFLGLSTPEGRARGGPTPRGQTFVVGEEGPELFTSDVGGTIFSNQELMAALSGGREQFVFAPQVVALDGPALDRAFQLRLPQWSAQVEDRLRRRSR